MQYTDDEFMTTLSSVIEEKVKLAMPPATSPHDFIFNGEFLIRQTQFGWVCFPKDQLNHALSYVNDKFDLGMRRWVLQQCTATTTYIDIGANAGIFCGIAARKITENGQIIAVEPIQALENSIRMNVQLNNPLCPFYIHHCAIGVMDGETAIFDIYERDNRISTLYAYDQAPRADTITQQDVVMQRFENIVQDHTDHIVIKIDAEGAEIEILSQIFAYFQSKQDLKISICFEYAKSHIERAGFDADRLMQMLRDDFAADAFFVNPITGATNLPFAEKTKNRNGNIAFSYDV